MQRSKPVKYYYINSHLNGYVLEVVSGCPDDGAQVITYPKNSPATDHQLWRLDRQSDGSFLIVSKLNGKVMDMSARGRSRKDAVVVYERSGHDSQRWRREGSFIVSALTGEALDVEGNSCSAATRIITWPCKWFRTTNQQFDLEEAQTSRKRYFYITSHLNGCVLDIRGGSRENCAQVINYPKNSPPSDNQLWYLDFQSDGSFLIVSKLHGKVLSIRNGGREKGARIVVDDYDHRESQQWRKKGCFVVSVLDGSVLDVEGESSASGTRLISWPAKSPVATNQQFEFEEVFKSSSDGGAAEGPQTQLFRDPLQFQISQPPLYSPPPPPYTALPAQSPDSCHSPQGYTIMDAFREGNVIQLVACSNRYPVQISDRVVYGNGAFSDPKTYFIVVVPPQAPPDVVMVKNVCETESFISVREGQLFCQDRAGPSCHFLVHVVLDNCVFLESSSRCGQSLSVSTNGVANLANFGEDDTQFVVRIVRQKYLPSAISSTPFGWPSIANRMRDGNVVQLYVRQDHTYVGINEDGNVVTVANGRSPNTRFVICDRGVCIYSLSAHNRPNFLLRVVNGATVGQGEPNFHSDFYLKERSDGDVSFESVSSPGSYISVQSMGHPLVTSFSMLFWDAASVSCTNSTADVLPMVAASTS
ncbi:hypothetical protein EMCRGX_G025277 [Ephydatia muelleri]